MKHLYTIALALAVALSALAGPQRAKLPEQQKALVNTLPSLRADHARALKNVPGHSSKLQKAPQRAIADDIIFDPEGHHMDYAVNASTFTYSFGIEYVNGDYPTEVVWGDNNDVYIKNIVTLAQGDVYVKGTVEGDKITVQFPQVCYVEIMIDDDYFDIFELYATIAELYTFEEDGQTYFGFMNVDENNQAVYTISDDGTTFTLNLNDGDPTDVYHAPERIIALVDDPTPGIDAWLGYGDSYQTFSVFNEEKATLPEGIELENWVIMSNVNAMAKVGFDGDDVYITNFWEFNPDLVAKGRVEGDKVILPTQYLGVAYGYFVYLVGCEWEDFDFIDYTLLDEYVLNYDAEAKIMSTDNELIDMLFNGNLEEYYPLDYYENPTFRYQTAEDTNAAPADPYVAYFEPYEYRDYLGYEEGHIEWFIPQTNVNGFLLSTENMYYNFYINGELFNFTTDEYEQFDQDYTDVPYDFTDGWDIQVIDESHYISFRIPNVTSLGLQSFFKADDGTVYASNLVTYSPSGIASVTDELKTVEFFDINGRKVAAPQHGVYIMRATMADGSVKVTKVLR